MINSHSCANNMYLNCFDANTDIRRLGRGLLPPPMVGRATRLPERIRTGAMPPSTAGPPQYGVGPGHAGVAAWLRSGAADRSRHLGRSLIPLLLPVPRRHRGATMR